MVIDRREARWLVAVIVLILLLLQLPYALAYLTAPPDRVFAGSLFYLLDGNSYLAKIQQGLAGNWLFRDLYTPEPHPAGPLYLFYIAWGQIGRLLDLSPAATFAAARLVHDLVLLVTLYWFLGLVLPRRNEQRAALVLLAFSSGLGWLLVLLGGSTVLGDRPPDFWMPEANVFLTLFTFPHVAAATSLMLLTFGGLLLAHRCRRLAPALGAAVAAFGLAWVHPFLLVPVYVVVVAYLGWRTVECRQVPWHAVGYFCLCVAASLPVVAYLQFGVIAPNPVFQGWMDQNTAPSPNLLACLVGFGLLVPLALAGGLRVARGPGRPEPFALVWTVVGLALLYAPFSTQRRFSEGLHVAVVVLAVLGLTRLWRRLPRRRLARGLLTAALIVGLGGSTLLNWFSATTMALGHQAPYFLPTGEVEALRWLEANTGWDDTVLSSYLSGSYIPAWAGNRVVIGHWAETLQVAEKQREVEQVFGAGTSPAVRWGIVEKYGVRYLFYGPHERDLGGYDPGGDPSWEVAFANDNVRIYRAVGSY